MDIGEDGRGIEVVRAIALCAPTGYRSYAIGQLLSTGDYLYSPVDAL